MTIWFWWHFNIWDISVLVFFFCFSDSSVLVTLQFWWHFWFGDISVLVTFHLKWHFSLGDISLWWHFSFGVILVLETFQFWWYFRQADIFFGEILTVYCLLSTFYCLLCIVYCLGSTVYCLGSTVYCLRYTVYWLTLSCNYIDCLALPTASPVAFDIPSQGVQRNKWQTDNKQHLKYKASPGFGPVGFGKAGDWQYTERANQTELT